jgi:hypothetical protein
MKSLGKGCFGRFGMHYGYFHYFLWEKESWLTTSPRERIEFISQGSAVYGTCNQKQKITLLMPWRKMERDGDEWSDFSFVLK